MAKADTRRTMIKVDNVHKDFHLPHHSSDSVKDSFINIFKKKDKGVDIHHALKGVSFEVKEGEFFGVLGRNGSGKSTLLKILAEIYQPTKGKVSHRGKLVPFIELGVGFKPELTGRDNVYLNGAMLGFTRKEIDAMYDSIVEFAELEDFMDQKLKNYSSGMKVRLAFSVAIKADADILLLDEVLAVGDAAFQEKCYEYFEMLKKANKTVILVTHSMGNVRRFCDKAIVINSGRVIFDGDADEAADTYLELFETPSEKDTNIPNLSEGVKLEEFTIVQNNKKTNTVKFQKDFSLVLKMNSEGNFTDVTMGLQIVHDSKGIIVAISSKSFGGISLKKGLSTLELDIQNILKDGNYYINIAIEENKSKKLLIQKHRFSPFSVNGLTDTDHSRHSLVYPNIKAKHYVEN